PLRPGPRGAGGDRGGPGAAASRPAARRHRGLRGIVAGHRAGLTRAPAGRPPHTARLGESPVTSSTRRTVLWALALVTALVLVGLAFVRGEGGDADQEAEAPVPAGPRVPDDLDGGCGDAAATDTGDVAVDRRVARCAPGAPAPSPLPEPATLRVAVPDRTASAAPLFVADALDEFAAENLTVEIAEMSQADAYAAMAAGDLDVVVGGIDGPFFDAVHDGLGARLVLGGPLAGAPGDL